MRVIVLNIEDSYCFNIHIFTIILVFVPVTVKQMFVRISHRLTVVAAHFLAISHCHYSG